MLNPISIRTLLFALAWLASIASPLVAAAAHVDILVSHNGTRLVTGGYDDGDDSFYSPERVYEVEVEQISIGSPWESFGEPGFRGVTQAQLDGATIPLSQLPAGEQLGFNFRSITIGANTSNLWYWDGSGPVNFTPLDGTTSLQLDGAGSAFTTGADNSTVLGFNLQTVDGSPTPVHTHLTSTLGTGGGEPALGIYLASAETKITGGLANSDPFFLVYATVDAGNLITKEMHEAAADWVQDNLVNFSSGGGGAVPEPTTLGMLGLLSMLLGNLRRRRR